MPFGDDDPTVWGINDNFTLNRGNSIASIMPSFGGISGNLRQLSSFYENDPQLMWANDNRRLVDAQISQGQQGIDLAWAKHQAAQLNPFQKGVQTFGTIAQGLQGLGSMYLGWKSMKEQKRNNAFQRDVMNTNLNNSISDYNRRLTDTLTNRSLNNGGGEGWVSSQLEKYKAKRG